MDILLAMLNIFVDPKASVDRFRGKKWAWVAPILVTGMLAAIIGWISAPIVIRVMLQNPPEGANVEQLQQAVPFINMAYKIGSLASPILIGVMTLVSTALLLAACTVLDIPAKLGELYNLVAFAGLIPGLQMVAMASVIWLRRDDIQSMIELQPPFGLNILLPDDSSRILQGFLGYFTPFTIWYIVVLAFAFAYLKNVPKGKAFAATAPVWIFGLLATIVGSMFSRT
jgi:hypothetical protein